MANFKFDVDADGIALITWDKPGRSMNVIDMDAIAELGEIVDKVATDAAVKGAVITSGKEAFCGGADLTMLERMGEVYADTARKQGAEAAAKMVFDESRKLSLLYRRIETGGKPWVCALNGTAMGGGFELALCADFIVAGEGAKLGLPEVKLGILAGGGGTQRLVRLVGKQRALMLLMTGRFFSAAEALAMGAIAETAPTGQALARALDIAREIAAMPPISVQQIKEIVNAGLNAPLETALMLERKAFQLQFATQDQKEGMAAFIEKRKPTYEGK